MEAVAILFGAIFTAACVFFGELGMQYSVLSHFIKRPKGKSDHGHVIVEKGTFDTILECALRGSNLFDPVYYVDENEDVRNAINKGLITSADKHYFMTGYFEGRLPRKILVDERFYMKNNPDVAQAVRSGLVQSAQTHFERSGYVEGRLPYEGFSLFVLGAPPGK